MQGAGWYAGHGRPRHTSTGSTAARGAPTRCGYFAWVPFDLAGSTTATSACSAYCAGSGRLHDRGALRDPRRRSHARRPEPAAAHASPADSLLNGTWITRRRQRHASSASRRLRSRSAPKSSSTGSDESLTITRAIAIVLPACETVDRRLGRAVDAAVRRRRNARGDRPRDRLQRQHHRSLVPRPRRQHRADRSARPRT